MNFSEPQVTIGQITFNSNMRPGSSFYKINNIREFLSTLDTRHTESPRQGEHGTEDSLSQYAARLMPADCEIHAQTLDELATMEQTLRQTLALDDLQDYATDDGYQLVLINDIDGNAKQLYAKVLNTPEFTSLNSSRRMCSVKFSLYAKDPRIYSQTLQTQSGTETVSGTNFAIVQNVSPTIPFQLYSATTASLTVTNAGKFDARPFITIYGPTQSPRLTNVTSGKYINLSNAGGLTLLTGEHVEIDVNAKSITKVDASGNRTDVSGTMTASSRLFVLKAGSNALTLIDTSPDAIAATVTIQWRATWI